MKPVTLAFLGDVMLGRLVNEEIPGRTPESFWGTALPVLRVADAVLANLECAITEHKRQWSRTYKVFHFGASPAAVPVLRAANIRYVSLANNHTLDFEETGLLDTVRHLDEAGIRHAGAGRDLAEAMRPALFEVSGIKIGAISLTDNEPAFAAGRDRPGTYYVEDLTHPATLEPIEEQVAELRRDGADLVVLSAHLGPNMVLEPAPEIRAFARDLAARGVDIFHGHSAHLFQGIEVREGRAIFYDTGDFLDDYAVDPELRNDWSFIFLADLEDGRLRRLRLVPVRLDFARVDLATGDEFEAIRRRMRELCRGFGTRARPTPEGLEIAL